MLNIVLIALVVALGQTSIRFNIPGGEETFVFDPEKIRAADMRRFARLSPEISATPQGFVGFSLEDCPKKDSRYRSCRTITEPNSPAFRHNAKVNLNHNLELLRTLTTTKYPEVLSPVVRYVHANLEFFQWRQTQRLKFMSNRDFGALKETFNGFDAGKECAAVIAKIEQSSKNKQRELVLTEWGDCVNSHVRRRYGEYPTDAWKRFLAQYGIKDEVRMYE